MNEQQKPITRLSFGSQLMLFGVVLVSMIAIPVFIIEVQRPWQLLDDLIAQAKIVITETKTNFQPEELALLNDFALEMNELADPEQEDYLIWAFGLNLSGQDLLGEADMLKIFQADNVAVEDFDYQRLVAADNFWHQQFDSHPGVENLLVKYKRILQNAKQASQKAGFDYDDLYIMVDSAAILTFIIDGGSWWETSYPGLEYDVQENDCPYFRDYLKNGQGYYSDPIYYHFGIFPKFNSDKWGTWFSTWLAEKNQANYNSFAIDFKADRVKKNMWAVFSSILLGSASLLAVIIIITVQLSKVISAPIKNLVTATEEIKAGNYEITVENTGSKEFGILINAFNQMAKGLMERLNLLQTLEKLLSKELAAQVAKEGLVLGGEAVHVSIMYTDFAGFSSMSKALAAVEVVNLLNDYWAELIPIIKKWGGLPDKYIGDSILAMFGAPIKLDNHAESAVACAIEMQQKMRLINEQRIAEGKIILEMRIGINSGEVIAGAIGSEVKLEYTTIGEPSNLANRMEGLCQIGHVLIAQACYELIKGIFFDGVDFEEAAQQLFVKGYDEPVSAYNIFVANLEITKCPDKAGTNDYYHVQASNHSLKFVENMSAEQLGKFHKVVKINLTTGN